MKSATEYLEEIGVGVANTLADELVVKNALMQEKNTYVQEKASSITASLTERYNLLAERLKKLSEPLSDEMQHLPPKKGERFHKEITQALLLLKESADSSDEVEPPSLGLTTPTLAWIYQVGYDWFQKGNTEEALGAFQLLAIFNASVISYWMAIGAAESKLNNHKRALEAFSMASLLDPEYAPSRQQSAKEYLHLEKFEDSLLELEALENIISTQKLDSFKAPFEKLLYRAKNKQKL